MGLSQKFSSLFSCELIQVQNVESIKSKGNLFARFYLPAGSNKRIQLNSKKIPSKSFPFWNESFNLDCSCPQEFLDTLKRESLVLELRQSKKIILGSHLVGKGEVPWKEILESPKMEYKEWVKIDLASESGCQEAMLKAPKVQVEVKIKMAKGETVEKENRRFNHKWDECGCKDGHDQRAWLSAEDYDIFALGAALEAF